jgi:predicted nucleic acid-binding protein
MFLLDTNVISELRKAGDGKADSNVVAWLSRADTRRFYLSAVTVMEIDAGVRRIERRDRVQGARLRTWMDHHILPPLRAASCARPKSGARLIDRGHSAGAWHDGRDAERRRLCQHGCSDPQPVGCGAGIGGRP